MNNNKNLLFPLIITLIAIWAIRVSFEKNYTGDSTAIRKSIIADLKQNEDAYFNFVKGIRPDSIGAYLLNSQKKIKALDQARTSISFYVADSIFCWTSSPPLTIEKPSSIIKDTFVYQSNTWYEIIPYNISLSEKAIGIVSVATTRSNSSESNLPVFKAESHDRQSTVFIKGALKSGSIHDDVLRLILFLICCVCLLSIITQVSLILLRIFPEYVVSLFTLFAIFGLRYVYSIADISEYFNQLSIFNKTLNSAYLGSSIGDFLLNAVIFLWVVIYWFNSFKAVSYDHLGPKLRLVLGTSIFFAIVLGIIMITGIIKSTILDSNIYFDFENIFNLDLNSFILILGLMIVFISLFLFSQRLMFTIDLLKLSNFQRIVAICISLLISLVFLYSIPIIGINLKFFLFVLMYLLLLDFYSDSSTTDFTWLMIWLIIFSSFSAALLFTYNQGKEENQLKQYSKLLSNPKDKILERICFNIINESKINKPDIRTFKSVQYLSKFYQFSDTINSQSVTIWYPTEHKDLKWGLQHQNGNVVYRYGNYQNPTVYFVTKNFDEFNIHSGIDQMDSYSYKGLDNLDKYGFALYFRNKLIFQNLNFQSEQITSSFSNYKNLINQRFMVIGNRSKDVTGREVEISKVGGGLIKLLSLFSYIFVLLALTFLLFIALNTLLKFIPGIYFFEKQSDISLRNKIQIAIISMIVISFLAIGIITITYFNYSNKRALNNSLMRKVSNLSNSFDQSDIGKDLSTEYLKKASVELESEIMLYDNNGILIRSFPDEINKINPALQYLALHPLFFENFKNNFSKPEYFETPDKTYLIHRSGQDTNKPYYIMLPLSKTDITTNSQIADFIGALINTYVFLLLIASALALAVGRSITRPLFALGEKLNQLKLGKHNETLSWSKNDEIGFLVQEYNQMIVKLEQSADLLAKSEREDAWKEMARQVAHEIKNPLTPMKLNVQYLLHSYNSDPEMRESRIRNICQVLIQQIDNLSSIAGTFGEFAHDPKPNNEKINLNELILGIYELFEKTGNEQLSFSHNITREDSFVFADKSHLIRIINNLIKNAIQAIPNDQKGMIEVIMNKSANEALIEIRDNGHGIDLNKKDKIFMPNFTTKSGGSGLGLPICKKLIESMHGEIYFESEVNKGTTFFVKLPLLKS